MRVASYSQRRKRPEARMESGHRPLPCQCGQLLKTDYLQELRELSMTYKCLELRSIRKTLGCKLGLITFTT